MLMGRWSSYDFLLYIDLQVKQFSSVQVFPSGWSRHLISSPFDAAPRLVGTEDPRTSGAPANFSGCGQQNWWPLSPEPGQAASICTELLVARP